MKTFYGGIFMDKEGLRKAGIYHPIKLEYYKVEELNRNIEFYGIEVVKTEYKEDKISVEKTNVTKITSDEKRANQILDMLKRNEVTPIIVEDVVEDLVKY